MNRIFDTACRDLARLTCFLAFNSEDVRRPRTLNSFSENVHEKVWQILSLLIYIYRLYLLPFWLRFIGYRKYTSWTSPAIGSSQPAQNAAETKAYAELTNFSEVTRLSNIRFGDPEYERFISHLYNKKAHISPHSHSPGNPFHAGFPGNFLDHLSGVYKILVSWGQPQYVCRAGLFHSLYGTFDYRADFFFNLKEGRGEMQELIGKASEELAFMICTSDRIGLMQEIRKAMYGEKAAAAASLLSFPLGADKDGDAVAGDDDVDGNPAPPLIGKLSASGFPVRNHITQETHMVPPDCFAQFIIVMIADFMEQGALGIGSADADVCLFQFIRFRFFRDCLFFVKDYIRILPKVWFKYMGNSDDSNSLVSATGAPAPAFMELTRSQVLALKRMWTTAVKPWFDANFPSFGTSTVPILKLSTADQLRLTSMMSKCPYLAEPYVVLACCFDGGVLENNPKLTRLGYSSQKSLIDKAVQLLGEWGNLAYKEEVNVKEMWNVIRCCQR